METYNTVRGLLDECDTVGELCDLLDRLPLRTKGDLQHACARMRSLIAKAREEGASWQPARVHAKCQTLAEIADKCREGALRDELKGLVPLTEFKTVDELCDLLNTWIPKTEEELTEACTLMKSLVARPNEDAPWNPERVRPSVLRLAQLALRFDKRELHDALNALLPPAAPDPRAAERVQEVKTKQQAHIARLAAKRAAMVAKAAEKARLDAQETARLAEVWDAQAKLDEAARRAKLRKEERERALAAEEKQKKNAADRAMAVVVLAEVLRPFPRS